jgi:hypothetical protein
MQIATDLGIFFLHAQEETRRARWNSALIESHV